jgi:hypothetical protein
VACDALTKRKGGYNIYIYLLEYYEWVIIVLRVNKSRGFFFKKKDEINREKKDEKKEK